MRRLACRAWAPSRWLWATCSCMRPSCRWSCYSFNDNRLASVWGSFSLQAYGLLFADEQLRGAAWLSLKIALLAGAAATCLAPSPASASRASVACHR